ncbi:MAG TPA: M56 family metallopeptidase [Steroidobacteraceae bacterium]|nr:M56 family metallopeptidase [Steroidobacteraceae bacterium]
MTATLMQTLAWSLLHFLWQGAAIAALAAALMYVLRKPATRYLIGVGALALMLLSFIVTFTLLNGTPDLSAAATADGAPAAVLVPPGTSAPSELPWTGGHAAKTMSSSPESSSLDFAWVARGWLVGVFILALRIAFGLFVIEQLRRRNLVSLPDALVERFQALQARLGITRAIRYAQCGIVNVPAVIGFFRPVVLIPVRALTGLSPEQLEALIAHELGHIKRFDVAVNFVQVVVETLFFFHPAVWWLNKRIRADREDCCDDIAVSAGGSSLRYAKALATIVNWEASRRDVPSFAMAATGGPVAARVARLLGVRREGSSTAGVFTAAVVLAGALVVGAVSMGFAEPAQAQADVVEPAAPVSPPSPANIPLPASPPSPASPVLAAVPATPAPAAKPAPAARPAPRATSAPMPRRAPAARPSVNADGQYEVEAEVDVTETEESEVRDNTSYIEEIRAVVGDVDIDDVIALKTQGVTAKYITQMRSRGIHASVDEIVAMKAQGVTPDYVKQVRDMGFDVSTDELIAFKAQGITPEYVQQVRDMGFAADADSIVSMKIQGVTADYVKQMRDLGLKFGADELVALRVQDISPDYVKQMRANGFDANTDQLIALRVQGVTPEYRKKLEAAGFKLGVDELVQAKVMDITPEFIGKVTAHGFKNLNIDQLIALKNADVL